MSLLVPLKGGGQAVAVEPADLALDGLLRILRSEEAPVSTWLSAGHHLLAAGREKEFEALLTEAVEREQQQGQTPQDVFTAIQALCSLAEFTAQQAVGERDRRQRFVQLSRSTELCHRAQRLSFEEQLPELVLGYVALVKGDVGAAKKGFEKALRMRCNGRPSIAAHLALASLQFSQRNFTEALRLYKQALRSCPSCPPEVRLGIATCCLKLGNTQKAELAYRRTLELSPDCTPALLGLAVLKLHASNEDEGVRDGSRLLAQAFACDPQDPFVLLLLAHFCLRQGFADKARQLAATVVQHTGHAGLQAEGLTILARAYHALGKAQEAYRYYQQAAQLDPKAPLPKLGLAQISVLAGEPTNAVSILENVLLEAPQWIDALEVLGRVYPKTALKGTKVAGQFKEAAAQRPQNADLWELLGDVLSSLEPAGALKAYDKAIEIRRTTAAAAAAAAAPGSENGSSGQLPARLLNNAAVLHLRSGDSEAAYGLMQQAMQSAAGAGLADLSPLAQVSLGYNLARVKEACGSLKAAEAEYRELLKQFPQYGDCCLRLACIARARGDTKEALSWAEQAGENPAYRSDALALQAGLYLEKRDYHNAKQVLDKLLEQADSKQETFAKLAMANVHAYSAPYDRRKDGAVQRAEVHYSHALELYRRVLEKDEGCISAANGVGCVLAEMGNYTAAKEVFLQVQEASAASDGFWRMPDAWVNLANVYLAQQQYIPAIQMYKTALRKFYDNRSAIVMLYLARAQYDADQLPEAKRTLTKALHLAPTDHNLRFDVAVTMQEWAVRTLSRKRPPGDASKHEEYRRAVRDLEHAHRFFQQLHGLGKASGLDARKLQQHINFIADTHTKSLAHVEHARQEAEQNAQKQAAATAAAVAEQTSRRFAEEKRKAEELALKRRQEEQARGDAERLRQLQHQWRSNATMAKAVATGDASAVAKGVAQDAEAALNARVDAMFASSDEDEDYNPEEEAGAGAGGPGGGLEQGAAAAGGQGAAGEGIEDEFDDDFGMDEDEGSEGEGAGAAAPPAAAAAAAPSAAERPKKRQKHQAVLDDEDEDE